MFVRTSPTRPKRSDNFLESYSSGSGATVTFAGAPRRRPSSYAPAFGGGCLQTLSVGRGFGWVPNLFFTPGSHGGGESSKARGTSTNRIIPESRQLVSERDVSGRHVEQVDIQSLKFPEHPLHNGPAFTKLLLLLLLPARPYVIRKL